MVNWGPVTNEPVNCYSSVTISPTTVELITRTLLAV